MSYLNLINNEKNISKLKLHFKKILIFSDLIFVLK